MKNPELEKKAFKHKLTLGALVTISYYAHSKIMSHNSALTKMSLFGDTKISRKKNT